ncbi:MAG: Mu transposase C-terminal domain-containing protein, partial [Phycisphaerae bacterium]|nr:Mu transposase C-terminal domain-containing protein [Phycisphaerae bacterium]
AWLTTDYELQTSPSKAASGLSVLRAFRELRRPDFKAVKPSDDVLSLLLMPSLPVVVSQNGIYVRDFGQHYWSDALEDRRCCNRRDRKRKIVYRYNPADETCIYVFNAEDDKFICVATPYIGSATHPLAESDHETGRLAAAIALQRHVSKTTNQKVRELRKTAGNKLLAASQQAGIKLGERDNPRAIADPPSAVIKLNGTGQLDRAARTAAKQKQQHEINQQQRETLTQEFLVTGTDSLKADQQELLDPLTALITKEVNNYE